MNNELTPEQQSEEVEAALTNAENAIHKQEYSGFADDDGWCCVPHALVHIWKSDLAQIEQVVHVCETSAGELRAPDGSLMDAWHADSFQFSTDPEEYAEGIYCRIEGCHAEIYPADAPDF